ncbi:MAG: hypothetical protein A3D92_08215 [Bacteroidetes bacterium RIFCSPHIGHO2_02_FULL_44_7]|nr:MAG: hypothetical protein A3D92_08215 [Bacteroidetes bacterium RIFCSPHIGHO2_02_FULL_44_7]
MPSSAKHSPIIRAEVLNRMILAKSLLRSAESLCGATADILSFSKGILFLHDAAESALGAVADHLHAAIPNKDIHLLGYFDLIDPKDPSKSTLPYRTQMKVLNTLRVNIKHSGILPSIKENIHMPSVVRNLLEVSCLVHFGMPLDEVSLKSLIKKKAVVQQIKKAEEALSKKKYQECLLHSAYAMYEIFDRMWAPQRGEEIVYADPRSNINAELRLIEKNVALDLYRRFKLITPIIGKNMKTNDLVARWDRLYGNPGNWNAENARFCLDFCIDVALKDQRDHSNHNLMIYSPGYFCSVEPIGRTADFWSAPSSHSSSRYFDSENPRRKMVTFYEGKKIIGCVAGTKDESDLLVVSTELPHKDIEETGFAYVDKNEVKITRLETLSDLSWPEIQIPSSWQ